MIAADKGCRRKRLTTTYEWSPSLQEAGQAITYWKGRKKLAAQGGDIRNLTGYLAQLHEDMGIESVEKDMDSIELELRKAWRNLREVQKEDSLYREKFLSELAEQHAIEQNIQQESAVK